MTPTKNRFRTVAALILLAASASAAAAQDARAILDEADRIFELDRVYSRSTLSVTRNGRDQAPQEMEGFSLEAADGTARALTVFRAPARVEGTAYLTIGDDLWVRFASTGRTRKMSSSAKKNSAAGSDFSYADMGEGNDSFTDQYEVRYDGQDRINGESCHRLVLDPRRGERDAYEKLIAWISEDDGRYRRVEYWDKGAPIKVMDLGDYRPVGGLSYPFRVVMTSLTRDSVSVVETQSMEFDSPRVEERFFTTAYLEDIR